MKIVWTQGAPLSIPRGVHAGGIVGGKLIIAGGSRWPTADRKERLRRVDLYDPLRDNWSRGQDIPRALDGAAGGVLQDRLLVLGGYDGSSVRREIFSGDGRGEWETVALLPSGRALASSAVIGSSVYLCGGTQRPDTLDDDLPTLFRIDTTGTTARVQTCRPFPGEARAIHASATINEALFVFGGASVKNGKVRNSRETWRYVPGTDRWERLQDAPCAIRGWAAVALPRSRSILLMGGYRDDETDSPPGFRKTIWAFDTVRGRWSQAGELPSAVGVTPFGLLKSGLLLAAGGEDAPRHRAANTLRGQIISGGT